MSSKKAPKPLPTIDLGQLANVTGGCGGGGGHHHKHHKQQQGMITDPYQNPGHGGYPGSGVDVTTTVDTGAGGQQVIRGGGYGIPTGGNDYNR